MRELLVVISLTLVVACGGRMRPVGPPVTGPAPSSVEQAQGAILSALDRLDYLVESQTPGAIVAAWRTGDRWFRVQITITAAGYEIALLHSGGLRQAVNGNTGQMMISSTYHGAVRKLDRLIRRGVGAPEPEPGSTGPTGEQVIALAGPVNFGVIERGVMLASLEVDQSNGPSGVLTTKPADTGYRRGSIDGETATLFLSYTVAVSGGQVRVVQRVQRCIYDYVVVGRPPDVRCSSIRESHDAGRCS